MLALSTSPLNDSTNDFRVGEGAEATATPFSFLSLLAEASLERLSDTKRFKASPALPPTSLECEEVLEGGSTELKYAELSSLETSIRPRSSSSSRSTSPLSGPGPNGKSFLCNHCGREYASTDAVRKHARQNHPDWLKEQGQGCPTLYCTVIENPTGVQTALDAVAQKTAQLSASKGLGPQPPACVMHLASAASSSSATTSAPANPNLTVTAPPPAMAANLPPPEPSPADPAAAHVLTGLMSAAESCVALSMAAHADEDEFEGNEYAADEYTARADHLAALLLQRPPLGGGGGAGRQVAGQKRPRSVRCGNCEGCTRDDCGVCKNCVDKPKFGGAGMRKQGCVRKICRAPRAA